MGLDSQFFTLSSTQVTRVVLLWVNNHFSDFEGDPDMTNFLEEFQSNLEKEVWTSITPNYLQ